MNRGWVRAALPIVASALVAAGVLSVCVQHTRVEAPAERPRLASLETFDLKTFKRTFNAGAGGTRVVAMLSPT
jgi:hypothetical protein